MATETSSNANIQSTTRRLFLKTVKSQVFMKMPLYARLLLAKKITWKGGQFITRPVDKAEMDDVTQEYLAGAQLTQGRKTLLETPYFHWKYAQTPVSYNVEEELQNGGGADTAPVDFIAFLVKKAQRAARLTLYKNMYGIGMTDASGLLDTGADDGDHMAKINSVRHALAHDITYAHLTRTISSATNTWWQGASIDQDYVDWDTARSPSLSNFRKVMDAVQLYAEQPGDLLCVVGPIIFRELQSQVETKHIYSRDGSPLAKYGFTSMVIDGVEVVMDPFLRASQEALAYKWMFMFNISDWEFRLHPRRSFNFTGFKWQGDRADGYDEWLARILIAGNLCCWKPNGSCYLSNVA